MEVYRPSTSVRSQLIIKAFRLADKNDSVSKYSASFVGRSSKGCGWCNQVIWRSHTFAYPMWIRKGERQTSNQAIHHILYVAVCRSGM